MGKIRKLLTKVGFSVLATLAIAGLFATNVANASQTLIADEASLNGYDESSFYALSYENDEVTVLLNANPRAYKNVHRDDLAELKSKVIGVIKDLVGDKLSLIASDLELGPKGLNVLRAYLPVNPDVDVSLLRNIIISQLTTNGVADREKVDAFLADENGTYKTMTQFYTDRYLESYMAAFAAANPGIGETALNDKRVSVAGDIAAIIAETVQEQVDAAYAQSGETGPDAGTVITALVFDAANPETHIDVDLNDYTNMLLVLGDAIISNPDVTVEKLITNLGGDTIGDEIKDVLRESEANELVDFLVKVNSDVVKDVVTNIDINSDEMMEIVENIGISKVLEVASKLDEETTNGLKEIFKAVNDNDDSFKDKINEYVRDQISNITFKDIRTLIKTIKIDGNVVFANDSFATSGIKEVLKSLPKVSEIKNFSDDQMKLSFDISIETTISDVDFKFTFGFFGDCTLIRRAFSLVDELIDASYVDGKLKIAINVPEALARIVKELSTDNEYLTDDLKHRIFDFLFSTVSEMYETLQGETMDDIISLLEGVDYQKALNTLLSAESLNELLGTTVLTNERIDTVINGFFKLVNLGTRFDYDSVKSFISSFVDLSGFDDSKVKVLVEKFQTLLTKLDAKNIDADLLRALMDPNNDDYTNDDVYALIEKLSDYDSLLEKVQEILDKVYNKLPERVKDNSVMDFYKGNGDFAYAGTFNLDYRSILNTVFSSYGDKIYDVLNAVFDSLPTSISLDFTAHFEGFYGVTYNISETETKRGLLPVGSDAAFFANTTEVDGREVIKWVDETTLEEVTEMPEGDIVIRPVLDFEITLDEDEVEFTYGDDEGGQLGVTVDPSDGDYTYQWYDPDNVAISGATSATLDVSDYEVSQSGDYYVTVSYADGTYSKDSDPITLTIKKVQVEKPEEDTSEHVYNYSGHYYNNDEGIYSEYYTTQGDIFGSYAGQYTITFELCDTDNYEWEDGTTDTISYDWEIKQFVVTKPEEDTSEFVYNAEMQTYGIEVAMYPEIGQPLFTVNEGMQMSAGTHTVTVTLIDKLNFVWDDGTTDDIEFTWVIKKCQVTIPSFTNSELVYTGSLLKAYPDLLDYNDETLFYLESGESEATNIGTYTFTLALRDSDNYEWADGTIVSKEFTWKIVSAKVTAPTEDTTTFAYDGTEQEYAVPEDSRYTVTGNKQTNAGTYEVVITLKPGYVWADGSAEPIKFQFIINKAKVTAPTEDTTTFTYDGTEQEYNIPTNDHYTVTGNKQTNAGTYTVKVLLTDKNNYEWSDGTNADLSFTWVINKAIIGVDDIEWNYTEPFTYDGEEHTVTINESTLPAGVKVAGYQNNKYTEAGTYNAVATLELDANYANNYELAETSITLAWEIKQGQPAKNTEVQSAEKDDGENPYVIVTNEAYPIDATDTLVVGRFTTVENPDLEKYDWTTVLDNQTGYIHEVYDITFERPDGTNSSLNVDSHGNVINENCVFTVKVLIPAELRNQGKEFIIVYMNPNGELVKLDAHLAENMEGKYMEFETLHFSQYALLEVTDAKINPVLWIVVIALLLVVIALQVVILLKSNKKGAAPAEQPAKEETKEEPVEEVKEEPAPVLEEPAAEEEIEEVRPEEPEPDFIITEDGVKELLNRSFEAKLRQTDDDIRAYYNTLKNEVLSYRSVRGKERIRDHISWKHEMFYVGNKKVAKFKLKRKSLVVCLPLDPKQFEGTSFKVKDGSNVASNAATPTLYTIKNDRRCKYAKQLIAQVLEPLGLKKNELPEVNYLKDFRYASNKTLLAKGLIKVETAPASLFTNDKPADKE